MELSNTWQVVIAAGALNCELVPVDALTFCDFYDRRRTSFREWLTIDSVREGATSNHDVRTRVEQSRR